MVALKLSKLVANLCDAWESYWLWKKNIQQWVKNLNLSHHGHKGSFRTILFYNFLPQFWCGSGRMLFMHEKLFIIESKKFRNRKLG